MQLTMENGTTAMKGTEKANRYGLMAQFIQDIGLKIKLMVEAG